MKKVKRIKISVTTREILIAGSAAPEFTDETELELCPACHTRIADAVGATVSALSEGGLQNAGYTIETDEGDGETGKNGSASDRPKYL